MKKIICLLLFTVLISVLPSAVSAKHTSDEKRPAHPWAHPSYHGENWHKISPEPLPFRWHEHHHHFPPSHYRMERIHDHEWNRRFPGLHSYHWHDRHGEGFWYRGERIREAVFFYNEADRLVSIGFMHHGMFIFIREDHEAYENRDSFFLSWWHRW